MSYANYCQDQSIDCVRRARLASSPEVAIYWRRLAFRWLRLAEQADGMHARGNASDQIEGASLKFSDLDLHLKRETTHAKANADARNL